MSELEIADIEASQKGDHDAYRRLVKRYEAIISRLMWRFSNQIDVCEELTHDTFIEAYTSLGQYQFRGPFTAWLKRIATRMGYRYWKELHRARKFAQIDEIDHHTKPTLYQGSYDPEALTDYLLGRLKPTERLILILLYFDNCSTKEISDQLGWTRGMVKMRAYRARQKLKAIVERERLLDNTDFK